MTQEQLNEEYFDWMYHLVCDDKRFMKTSYLKLFHRLYNIEFTYIIAMDGNRAEDGIALRYRFGYENKYEDYIIANLLDNHSCSILEMLVALSLRCEEHIMYNQEIGDRTGQWFWNMIRNLGLYSMDDTHFNADYVNDIISKFLKNEYEANGKGGLFTIENYKRDLRSVEIWYQMSWYLNEVLS